MRASSAAFHLSWWSWRTGFIAVMYWSSVEVAASSFAETAAMAMAVVEVLARGTVDGEGAEVRSKSHLQVTGPGNDRLGERAV